MKLLSNGHPFATLRGRGSVRPGCIREISSCPCVCRNSSLSSPALSSIDQEEESESIATTSAAHQASFIDSRWFKDRGEENVPLPSVSLFRFWHDEKKFKGNGENSLAQRALFRLGGLRTGGNVKSAQSIGPLGHQRRSQWDLLWSPASYSHKCFDGPLRPSAMVSAVPGSQCLTKKKRLSQTLYAAYGEEAWDLMPRTFSLPSEVGLMMEWMKTRAQSTPEVSEELWMLKTAQHLGLGLKLVPFKKALKEMVSQFQRSQEAKMRGAGRSVRPYVCAQAYVTKPLLILGRKFGLRVWVVIVNDQRSKQFGLPLISFHLHQNGLVLFSNEAYQDSIPLEDDQAVPSFAVTNYAMNRDGTVWPLSRLESELGNEKFEAMQAEITRILSRAFAASLGHLESATSRVKCSCFELFGVDILIDSSLKPWILEINSTPSLEVSHKDEVTEQMIYEEKNGMIVDLFRLLDVPGRFQGGSRPSQGTNGWKRLN